MFTPTERGTLLEILAITGEAGTAVREEFDAKLEAAEALEDVDGRETRIRGYIAQWAAISTKPADMNSDGIVYSTVTHQLAVYNKVAVALGYPALSMADYVVLVGSADTSGAQMVTITLGGLYGTDEYGY